MRVVGGHDEEVMAWASQKLGKRFYMPASAHGIIDGCGVLCGAVIWNDYQSPNGSIEMTYVGEHTITRRVVRELAQYAFGANNVSRVTCKTRRGNKAVCAVLPRLGFIYEGILHRFFGPRKSDDAVVYALLRSKVPQWIWNEAR